MSIHLCAVLILGWVGGFAVLGAGHLQHYLAKERASPYGRLARSLNVHRGRETCDVQLAGKRYYSSAVLDRFRAEIHGLWRERPEAMEPKFSLLDLGVIRLRINPKAAAGTGFDASAWSWDDVFGLIQKAQHEVEGPANADHWRDADSMVRFLLEKDYARIVLGRKFLTPAQTQHTFRPNPSVSRSGPHEFTVRLDPGTLRGHEQALRNLLEEVWSGPGYHVRIQWSRGEEVYRLLSHFDSNRSFVNHQSRTMDIANLAWTKTVAHELGHVLGFDDHYYNVWNARNCYYSQESRLGDLMSNSEHGAITARHWEILDRAYPWKKEGPSAPFPYAYGQ